MGGEGVMCCFTPIRICHCFCFFCFMCQVDLIGRLLDSVGRTNSDEPAFAQACFTFPRKRCLYVCGVSACWRGRIRLTKPGVGVTVSIGEGDGGDVHLGDFVSMGCTRKKLVWCWLASGPWRVICVLQSSNTVTFHRKAED